MSRHDIEIVVAITVLLLALSVVLWLVLGLNQIQW